MFVVLRAGCTAEERGNLIRGIEEAGLTVQVTGGGDRVVLGIEGDPRRLGDMVLDQHARRACVKANEQVERLSSATSLHTRK